MKDLISVIIPVHNVEEYIERCLKSIIKQTYSNIEIIIIIDNCSDASEDVCRRYKEIDKRIKIKNVNYGSAGLSRNEGIKIAIGNYICFVDSDDYVSESYIDILYNSIITNNYDLVVCGYNKVGKGIEKSVRYNSRNLY